MERVLEIIDKVKDSRIWKNMSGIAIVFAFLAIVLLYFVYDKTGGHFISQILGTSTKVAPTPTGVSIRIFDTPIPRITQTAPTSTPQQSSEPTAILVDCVGPDGKHFEVTRQECDEFNLSWHPERIIVTCKIDNQCGGGAVQLQRGICENSTCCQIGDKWTFYQDKNKCKQDQNIYNASLPTPTSLPTSTPTPIPTFTPTPTPDNLQFYNRCISNAQNTYDQKLKQCLTRYGGGGIGMACAQQALQIGQQTVYNCNLQYPH
jgi:hypothetical protein